MTDYRHSYGPRSPDEPKPDIGRATLATIAGQHGTICVYCWQAAATEVDHVYPWIQGGPHEPSNFLPCCRTCNAIAGMRVYPYGRPQKEDYIRTRRAEIAAKYGAAALRGWSKE